MDLRDVAAVSGKSGLFKVLKPTRNGVVLETIDDKKQKISAGANHRVSILKEISIYTTSAEGTVLLEDVYAAIFEKYGNTIPVSNKSSEIELVKFLAEFIPDYDRDRVYISDMKKLVNWYNILVNFYPEVFTKKEEEAVNA